MIGIVGTTGPDGKYTGSYLLGSQTTEIVGTSVHDPNTTDQRRLVVDVEQFTVNGDTVTVTLAAGISQPANLGLAPTIAPAGAGVKVGAVLAAHYEIASPL